MTDKEIGVILASRGYRRIASPYPGWNSWLWVEPVRPDGIPTKLCQWASSLDSNGLHWLLDSSCELQGEYYSDEQRASNRRSSLDRNKQLREESNQQ